MRVFLPYTTLILIIAVINSSIITNVKQRLANLKNSLNDDQFVRIEVLKKYPPKSTPKSFHIDLSDAKKNVEQPLKKLQSVINFFKGNNVNELKVKRPKPSQIMFRSKRVGPPENEADGPYHLDPVLNNIRRRRYSESTSTSDSSSSSIELRDWKEEWKEHWMKKKIQAINTTEPKGDVVNMVAARPWGQVCGDPDQHDMPWGTCMLPMECEPEFRIYRGDFSCGRTQFVCCGLTYTNYDLYQGFDVSFADSGLTTDSEEKREQGEGSRERRHKKQAKERKRRKRERARRKKKIKKNIMKIIKEMRKILKRQYINGTTQRKKKTKQLSKFIKELKKKYRQDRKTVKGIHEIELIKIDDALMKKLQNIRQMNSEFIKNDTFRDIVVNGTMSKQGARMLIQAYPELVPYFAGGSRRRDGSAPPADYLDYDVEYGMLYY